MARKILFFICLVIMWPAFANDTAVGGHGAAPMPINIENIKMAKEHVVIKGHQIARKDMRGEWRVHCDYVFTNTSNKAIAVKMAFPFPIKEPEEITSSPAGRKIKLGSALVHDFKVMAAGKTLAVSRIKLTPVPKKGLYYKDAYAWNLHFKPHETIRLQHDYLTGVTVNSVVQNRVYYVLKTGNLWQEGKIGHAILEVIPNTPTHLCSDSDSADYLKPKPAGMKVMGFGKDKKYVWNLKNFSPESDLELCLLTTKHH